MTSRYEVTLGGVKMSSLDANLLILDVKYSGVEKDDVIQEVANLDGYDISKTTYKRQTVTVTFELHIYGTAKRNTACQTVNKWARSSSKLTIDDRSGQYLTVHCETPANIDSARNWTDPLTLVFATDHIPFWQSNNESVLSLSGSTPSGTLKVDGNIGEALVNVEAIASAKVTSFSITVGNTKIELDKLNLGADGHLIIDYINGRYLRIRQAGTSVLGKLLSSSSDNLKATCGESNYVSIKANAKMTIRVAARGKWL